MDQISPRDEDNSHPPRNILWSRSGFGCSAWRTLVVTSVASCAMRSVHRAQRGTKGTVGRRRDFSHIDLSIVVPAFNEAERLPGLLRALRELLDPDTTELI